MDIWKILEINKTANVDDIKKAYRNKLKSTRPDDNQENFINLRDAYEAALFYAQNVTMDDEYDYENSEYDNEYVDYDYNGEYYNEFERWHNKLSEIYNDYSKRIDITKWEELIYEDIPFEIKYYETCRRLIFATIYNQKSGSVYLPRNVRILLDNFFNYCKSHKERAKIEELSQKEDLNKINTKFKLCENIEFDKLKPKSCEGFIIDEFFNGYEQMVNNIHGFFLQQNMDALKGMVDELKCFEVRYLPLECLYLYLHMNEFSENEIKSKIADYENEWGIQPEIEILKAQFALHTDKTESAKKIMAMLYKNAPTKNYVVLYQMSLVYMELEMYYEAYMIIKTLTWLRPSGYMYQMANNIYNIMRPQYERMLHEGDDIDDITHIFMSRIFMRSDEEELAVKVLNKVNDESLYIWEYNVARSMCIFYEESKIVPSALYAVGRTESAQPVMEIERVKPIFDILENYPKDLVGNIEMLEWKELEGRYLYEQRRYDECEQLCNELLEEYPLSYPVLMLRAYSDYGKNVYGKNKRMSEYMDWSYLVEVLPQRKEARLAAAQMMAFSRYYEEMIEVISPIKELLPDHYRFYKAFQYEDDEPARFIKEILELFKESMTRQLDIPPVSKYRLLNLKDMYVYACYNIDIYYSPNIEKIKELINIILNLKDAKKNAPNLYIEPSWAYKALRQYKIAVEIEEEKYRNATNEWEKKIRVQRIVENLVDYEKLKEYESYMSEEQKLLCFGYASYYAGNYEKTVEYFEKAEKNYILPGNYLDYMAFSYNMLGRTEDAINTYKWAIRKCDISGDSYYSNSNAYHRIALIYKEQKKWDNALEYIELAKKYSEHDMYRGHLYYYNIGHILFLRDEDGTQRDKAIRYIEKSIEYKKDFVEAYGLLAEIYQKMRNKSKAIEILEKAVINTENICGDYDNDENIYYNLFWLYQEERMFEDAVRIADKMRNYTNISSYQRKSWYCRGLANLCLENLETARELFKEYIRVIYDAGYEVSYHELSNIFLCYYGNESLTSTELALKLAHMNYETDVNYLMHALRNQYMFLEIVDVKLAKRIEQELHEEASRKMFSINDTSGEMKEIYEGLMEVYAALHDFDNEQLYEEKFYEEDHSEYGKDYFHTGKAWCHVYKGEFDKAFAIYDSNEKCKKFFTGTDTYIEYCYIVKKLEKEK